MSGSSAAQPFSRQVQCVRSARQVLTEQTHGLRTVTVLSCIACMPLLPQRALIACAAKVNTCPSGSSIGDHAVSQAVTLKILDNGCGGVQVSIISSHVVPRNASTVVRLDNAARVGVKVSHADMCKDCMSPHVAAARPCPSALPPSHSFVPPPPPHHKCGPPALLAAAAPLALHICAHAGSLMVFARWQAAFTDAKRKGEKPVRVIEVEEQQVPHTYYHG